MKTVVIIGAGPAGITAGYELLKKSKDYKVIILEESERIGGIACTVNYKGNYMDLGGHRFFSKSQEVNKWWNDILPRQSAPAYDDRALGREVPLEEKGADPEQVNEVMLFRNRLSRIYYEHKFFDYPIKINGATIKKMGLLCTFKAGLSYMTSILHKQEEKSLEEFYINRFGKVLYEMFFKNYTEKVWGRPPRAISANWGAQRVKGLSIVAIIKDIFLKALPKNWRQRKEVETSLIESFYYPKYGPGQLWEEAARRFIEKGGMILRGCKVEGKISQEGNKIRSIPYSCKGQAYTIEADYVFSTMPLKDLVAMFPHVPAPIGAIAEGLPYRAFVTVGLLVNRLNNSNESTIKTLHQLIPDCWIYVQDKGVKLGRIQIFNNWSPYLVKDRENTVWIGLEYFCNEQDSYWCMTDEEWQALAVKELVQMGFLKNQEEVLDFHKEVVGKAYPAYFDTYKDMDQLIAYLNQWDNLYCIGRNGQHRYNNMDHSMLTAFEATHHLLTGKGDKQRIWQVNTEKSYSEER